MNATIAVLREWKWEKRMSLKWGMSNALNAHIIDAPLEKNTQW